MNIEDSPSIKYLVSETGLPGGYVVMVKRGGEGKRGHPYCPKRLREGGVQD